MTGKAFFRRLFLLSLVLVFLFLVSACSGTCAREYSGEYTGGSSTEKNPEIIPSIEIAPAAPGVYAPYIDTPGTLVVSEHVTVSAPLSSEVAVSPVRAGSYVERGEILAELNTDSLERELLRLQSRLEIKRQELKTREYALEDAVQEAEKRWTGARRIYLELQQAEKSLKEALSAAEDSRELYEAGGIPRSTLRQSKKEVEQAEYEIERLALLLEEAAGGFNIVELLPRNLKESHTFDSLQNSEDIFTEEKKLKLIEETAKKNASFIRIAEAEIEEVEHTLQSVRDKIEKAAVRAPIDGVVESVNVQRGEFVETGRSMCRLYDPETLLIKAVLGESVAGKIEPGGRAELLPSEGEGEREGAAGRSLGGSSSGSLSGSLRDSLGGPFETQIHHTEPQVDSRNKSFTVYLTTPQAIESPIPGMFTAVRIYTGSPRPSLSLPAASLLSPIDRTHAHVLLYKREAEETGRVYRRRVELFGIEDETAYISSGIEAGAFVCISPPDVPEGSIVKGIKQ